MPGALFDANAVSDLMRGHPRVKARVAQHAGPLLTSVPPWLGCDAIMGARTCRTQRCQDLPIANSPVSGEAAGSLRGPADKQNLRIVVALPAVPMLEGNLVHENLESSEKG